MYFTDTDTTTTNESGSSCWTPISTPNQTPFDNHTHIGAKIIEVLNNHRLSHFSH